MKEKFWEIIGLISENSVVRMISENDFYRGIAIGIAVTVVFIFVFRFLLWICFRSRRCSEIVIASDAGEITIAAAAVASVLKRAGEKINGITVRKIRISHGRKNTYDISLRGMLDVKAGGTAVNIMERLSAVVKEQMAAVFGVTNINKLTLNIDSCSGSAKIYPADEKIMQEYTEDNSAEEDTANADAANACSAEPAAQEQES